MIVKITPSKVSLVMAVGVYSNIVAPIIAGTESRKENFTANSFLMPKSKLVEIVEPDLEIPGIIAKPCAIPIITAGNGDNFFFPSKNLVEMRNKAVVSNPTPTTFVFVNKDKKKSLKTKPIIAVGIEPIIK